MKWIDAIVVFGLFVVAVSTIISLWSSIVLDAYKVNSYSVLINGLIAAVLAIGIFLIGENKTRRREKLGKRLIISKLDIMIIILKQISGETSDSQNDEPKLQMNLPTDKKVLKIQVFRELTWLKETMLLFSDVIDFNEWYRLYFHVTIFLHRHENITALPGSEHFRTMKRDEDYELMRKNLERSYKYWEKYKPKNYDVNFSINPKYPET